MNTFKVVYVCVCVCGAGVGCVCVGGGGGQGPRLSQTGPTVSIHLGIYTGRQLRHHLSPTHIHTHSDTLSPHHNPTPISSWVSTLKMDEYKVQQGFILQGPVAGRPVGYHFRHSCLANRFYPPATLTH